MTPGRTRQQRYRARRRQIGARRVDLWLDAEAHTLVLELQQPGEPLDALMGRALIALKTVSGDGHSTTGESARDPVTGDALLLTLIQALLPEGKPVYLRERGVTQLPLALINQRLAPLGYVMLARRVRDARKFVACLDAQGRVEAFGLFELRRLEEP